MSNPRNISDLMRNRRLDQRAVDGFIRETHTLPIDEARAKARELLSRYPVGGYATAVESWRRLDDGRIEFTMRRFPTAD